jgi:hypothetical protein
MANEFRSKLRISCRLEQKITVESKKLEIRQSTNNTANVGVYSSELIKAGTIFFECGINSEGLNYKINDLAYHGQCHDYDTDENIEKNTNVGYIVQGSELYYFFGEGSPKIYLYAIKDIAQNEELSKHYGLDYWLEFEFWKKFPNCQWKKTHAVEDLPSEWVYVDELRHIITQNYHQNLFAKKVNTHYHYLISSNKPNYYDPKFIEKLDQIKIITKEDYSQYQLDDIVYNGMYLTEYLKKSEKNVNVPTKFSPPETLNENIYVEHTESRYKLIINNEDLPSSYIFIDCLVKDDLVYGLYAKKIGDQYFYLLEKNLSPPDLYYNFIYWSPDFDENSCEDVSKNDHSPYEKTELINGLHRQSYLKEQEYEHKAHKNQRRSQFWEKYPTCNYSGHDSYCGLPIIEKLPPAFVPFKILYKNGDNNLKRYCLYGKMIDNKYYYMVDLDRNYSDYDDNEIDYYDPQFEKKSQYFVDVTKNDMSQYQIHESILNNMHTSEHHDHKLIEKIKNMRNDLDEFWSRNLDSNFKKTGKPEDLPTEYISFSQLKEELNAEYYYDLYAKRINNQYYYLISKPKKCGVYDNGIEYYQHEFVDEIPFLQDATKKDYSLYNQDECIMGHLYFKNYLVKSALSAI